MGICFSQKPPHDSDAKITAVDICGLGDIAGNSRWTSCHICRGYQPLIGAYNEEDCCCIFWTVTVLSQAQQVQHEKAEIIALHKEIIACAELVYAVILEDAATSGLLLCRPQADYEMNQEDVAVRFGQLLCRWASLQEPVFHLRVGVDCGSLSSFSLPSSGHTAYTGYACEGARYLAHSSEQDFMVHLSRKVRERLCKLSQLKMIVSHTKDSYYLDHTTKVNLSAPPDDLQCISPICRKRSHNQPVSLGMLELMQEHMPRRDSLTPDSQADTEFDSNASTQPMLKFTGQTNAATAMTFTAFKKMLTKHQVNIDDFGRGDAKTLEELHQEVIIDKDSFLMVGKDSVLERVKEIIRISFQVRGSDNRLRELKLAAQQKADGQLRRRNQNLCAVLKEKPGDYLKETIQACFQKKLGLSLRDQTECLAIDWDSLVFREECLVSITVPNMVTRYKTHNLVVNVRDKTHYKLNSLGLPGANDFSTTCGNSFEYFWTWSVLENSKEDELRGLLNSHGIESSEYSEDAFAELYEEVYETCLSTLEVQDNCLVRKIRIFKIWLHADILSMEHVLQTKKKIQKGKSDEQDKGRPLAMRIPKDLAWEKAVQSIFLRRLGIEMGAQSCFTVDPQSYCLSEEMGVSRSFPGLKTIYFIDEVTAHVTDIHNPALGIIGLPDGHEFSFARWDPPRGPGEVQLVIQHWCWQSLESFRLAKRPPMLRTLIDHSKSASEPPAKRRVPLPDCKDETIKKCTPLCNSTSMLERCMRGRKTDWARARKAASQIRSKSYTCREFHADICAAFPELTLYLDQENMSSGRSGDDEYQRTMGAFFAVFWLMRLHLDGSECFVYGLGQDWNLRCKPEGQRLSESEVAEWECRGSFHAQVNWGALSQLMVDAGLIPQGEIGITGLAAGLAKSHDEERTLALLVLTAIHDIMKSPQLLPVVSKTAWNGFQVGDTIHDHDLALAYILERQPKALPSFAGLPKHQQASILFSQSKLEYNMGWLVQAEAPPGALLRKFREVVIMGDAAPRDIAFYFVHWFTDLAGAEPCPLEGCEKFVLKFPRKVLNQFLQTFPTIQHLSPLKTETQVMEAYLIWRWKNHEPGLGDVPHGIGAIARMRLVVMAQGDSQAILDGFAALPAPDRAILTKELAFTACPGQSYEVEPPQDSEENQGPALLVYYAPALMQKAGSENPAKAMRVLAEVFRQARAFWPLSVQRAQDTVIVRIDALKALGLSALLTRDCESIWVMTKQSQREATVQLLPPSKVSGTDWSTTRTLTFQLE